MNGIRVRSVGGSAFKDMPNLIKVTLPDSVASISEPPFSNCPNMMGLYLEHKRPPSVPATGLMDGASEQAYIYVQEQYYSTFVAGYTWMEYRPITKKY